MSLIITGLVYILLLFHDAESYDGSENSDWLNPHGLTLCFSGQQENGLMITSSKLCVKSRPYTFCHFEVVFFFSVLHYLST